MSDNFPIAISETYQGTVKLALRMVTQLFTLITWLVDYPNHFKNFRKYTYKIHVPTGQDSFNEIELFNPRVVAPGSKRPSTPVVVPK